MKRLRATEGNLPSLGHPVFLPEVPGESFRRYDLPVNVNTIHFKNSLWRAIVTQRPSGIISQSRELLSRTCKVSFVTL